MSLVQVKLTQFNLFKKLNVFVLDIVLKVRQPIESEVQKFREGSTLISFLYPAQNKTLIDKLAERNINAFGMYSR